MVQSVKNPHAMQKTSCNAADLVSIPGLGRYPGEGNDNPLRYSCLGYLMDKGTWQAPLFMGFSRQKYWSGLSFPSPGYLPDPGIKPGDLPDPGIEPASLAWQVDSLPLSHLESP